jgi:hypothetical protein
MNTALARVSTVTFGRAQLRTATSRSGKASLPTAHYSPDMSNNVEVALSSIRKPRFVLVSDLDHTMVSLSVLLWKHLAICQGQLRESLCEQQS